MAEVEPILQVINTVGFPIAACVALFYMCSQFIQQMQASNEENRKSISEMSATLGKLDATLEKIYTKLDQLNDRINSLENTVDDCYKKA